MENKTFMNADDIAEEMGISKSSAYTMSLTLAKSRNRKHL